MKNSNGIYSSTKRYKIIRGKSEKKDVQDLNFNNQNSLLRETKEKLTKQKQSTSMTQEIWCTPGIHCLQANLQSQHRPKQIYHGLLKWNENAKKKNGHEKDPKCLEQLDRHSAKPED